MKLLNGLLLDSVIPMTANIDDNIMNEGDLCGICALSSSEDVFCTYVKESKCSIVVK